MEKVQTRQIRFICTLPALQGAVFRQVSPLEGGMMALTLHFPTGCNCLVDISAGHGSVRAFPMDGFIALDDATPTFPIDEPVVKGENIWIQVENHDRFNPHTVVVVFTLEGVGA